MKGDRSKLLWANRAFREFYGMSNEQLQDLIDAPHSDPDDTIQYVRDDHHVFTTGEALDIPSEAVTDAQGEVSYFHTVKTPIKDQDGQVVRTVGVSRLVQDSELTSLSQEDRSQRKSSVNALRTLVSNIPLAVAMLDIKNRFLCHSQAWSILLGVDENSLDGEFYDSQLEDKLPLQKLLERATEEGVAQCLAETSFIGPLGKKIIADIEIHPWDLPSGEIGGTIVLVHDITLAKNNELRLQQLNDELMQFNYRVSHDLVAPLRTMRGYLNICQDELENNPQLVAHFHRRMMSSIDQASQLVQDVLNLARSDLQEEQLEPIELTGMVTEILGTHSEEIKKQSFRVELSLSEYSCISSRFRMKQILENLISNAIKYFDPNEAEHIIRVTLKRDGSQLNLEVTDNGLGFEEEQKESIFELFTRGGSKHPGNGLGLYLVKKHAEKLSGTVRVLSHRKNTVFQVSLPVVEG